MAAKKVVKKAPVKTAVVKKPVVKKAPAKKIESGAPLGLPEQMRDAALKILDERQAEEVVTITLAGRSSVRRLSDHRPQAAPDAK